MSSNFHAYFLRNAKVYYLRINLIKKTFDQHINANPIDDIATYAVK